MKIKINSCGQNKDPRDKYLDGLGLLNGDINVILSQPLRRGDSDLLVHSRSLYIQRLDFGIEESKTDLRVSIWLMQSILLN